MSPELLLKHFDQISDTPDAVPRLRRFILDLAVRGKLVEQNLEDEPVADLLKRLTVDTKFSQIENEELPFEIPSTWLSAKAGDLINMQYGKSLVAKDRKDKGCVSVYGSNGIVGYCDTALTEEPAIIIGRKGSAGALNLCNGPSWTTDVAYYLIPPSFFNIRFLFIVLQTLDLGSLGKGVKPGLNRTEAYQLPIVLPPLAEQHRIVAKVDEMMKLCDELEAAQAKRERRRDRLVAATLHGLNNGETDFEAKEQFPFEESARFYFNHLPRLTTRPEHIQQLRQTILNLAVRGKLVLQDPEDESAAKLLKRIQTYKEQLVEKGEVRKEKPLSPIFSQDLPFSIPSQWAWVKIGTCSLLTEYGTSVKSIHSDKGVPVLSMGNIQDGGVVLNVQKKVPKSIDDLPQLFLKHLDLLYNRTNSAELVGKTGIFMGEDDTYTFASYLIRIRFVNHLTSPLYINLAMNAPCFRNTQIIPELKQQCGQANVNGTKLKSMMVPLPPLAEQHRIVAKVDELMTMCDKLETQLTTNTTTCHQLLKAAFHEALYGRHALQETFR